jgi:hypothetical protein
MDRSLAYSTKEIIFNNMLYVQLTRRCLFRKVITANVQLTNKIIDRESQGTCHQDELIGGKSPVIKEL